jgi:hypothetical protein
LPSDNERLTFLSIHGGEKIKTQTGARPAEEKAFRHRWH